MTFVYGEHKLTRYLGESVAMSYNLRPRRGNGPVDTSHPGFLEIEVLEEGNHFIRLDGRVHEARSGDATVIPPGCVHSWWTEPGTARGYTVHVPTAGVDALGLESEQWPCRLFRASREMKGILALMRSSADSRDCTPLGDLLLEQLADALVVATYRELLEHGKQTPEPWRGRPPLQRLDDLADRLRDEPERPWTLEDMARLAGMSRFHFCRQFKARFRTTPRQYLLERRLALAKRTLEASQATLTHAAIAAGFNSSSQFSKDFKRSFGMPPSAWSKKRHHQ